MINVLIVEDSLTVGLLLRQTLESDSRIHVAGLVTSGEEALNFMKYRTTHVDVVTMDIILPGMDGFETTRRLMETYPLPIVVVSSAYTPNTPGEAQTSFKAMEAGAVAICEKPIISTHPDFQRISKELIHTVKLMSEVKVVTRFSRRKPANRVPSLNSFSISPEKKVMKIDLLAIGASTGGPPVLCSILGKLSKDIPVPILIVQHISAGFIEGLAQWLQSETGFPIHIPYHFEMCQPGHVYMAPDACHMGISAGGQIILEKSLPENGQLPSVSYLFRSAVRNFPRSTIGVLLTGMGSDGVEELKAMKDSGSMTLAQDEESCVVFGMPGEAVKRNAVSFVLPPHEIAAVINRLAVNR